MYLAKFFGLSVSSVINDFIYDETKTYEYPYSKDDQTINPPVNTFGWHANLEQAYWTIVSHFTNITEPQLR